LHKPDFVYIDEVIATLTPLSQ